MEAIQRNYIHQEEELAQEELALLQELSRLNESTNALHSELERVVEDGQRKLTDFKASQATIHAQMNYSIESTTKLIDKSLTEHNLERESIRKEFSFLSTLNLLCFHRLFFTKGICRKLQHAFEGLSFPL